MVASASQAHFDKVGASRYRTFILIHHILPHHLYILISYAYCAFHNQTNVKHILNHNIAQHTLCILISYMRYTIYTHIDTHNRHTKLHTLSSHEINCVSLFTSLSTRPWCFHCCTAITKKTPQNTRQSH